MMQTLSQHPPPERERPPWSWLDLWATAMLLIGAVGVMVVGLNILGPLFQLDIDGGAASPALYVAGMMVYLSLLLGIYLFAARRPGGWQALGIRHVAWWVYALLPLIWFVQLPFLALINVVVVQLSGGQFENPQIEAITGGGSMSLQDLLLLLVMVAGVVPIAEELFFRGMLYPLLRYHMGALAAITISAAIFAAFHLILQLLPALFWLGLILAILRERTGSTLPGIGLHALQNGIALIIMFLSVSLNAGG
ncbi:MAG: CPBP family intramembrane metalloprotease [Chloroflexaceae bacterium]|nr:CPBP family intramembrane metalloprotease [Chloroflexaceae bacterium]